MKPKIGAIKSNELIKLHHTIAERGLNKSEQISRNWIRWMTRFSQSSVNHKIT
jgi:hypothetical protein